MKRMNVEVEGGELLLESKEGHYAIIPAKDRSRVQKMVNDNCDDCINSYIKRLPKKSDYAEDGSLIEGFTKSLKPPVSTKEKPIFANEETGYGEVKKVNPIPLNTPYGRQYKNIVEKQEHYDYLSETYGPRVKYREDILNMYDKPLKSGQLKKIRYNVDSYNPENELTKDLSAFPEELHEDFLQYYDIKSEVKKMEDNWQKYENVEESDKQSKAYRDMYEKQLDLRKKINTSPYNAIDILDTQETTWRQALENRDDISNKALIFASLMEEGGNKYSNDNTIDGFQHFGLDRIGENINELISKNYLSKDILDRIDINYKGVRNEKNELIQSAKFSTFDDVITMKNAIFNQEKDLILKVAKKEGVELSDKAIEYFTIAGYNGGRGNAAKMLKKFIEDGLLEDDKFLKVSPDSYKRIHENVMRRLDLANMLEGEGIIKQNKNN